MVKINLVPERVRSAETLRLIVLLGSASLVLPVLFWAWQFGQAKSELAAVEEDVLKVMAELNSPQLKSVVQEVEQFTADRSNLESKRSVVDVLRKRQSTMVRFFDVLPDLVPKRAVITLMKTDVDKGKIRISVDGQAKAPEVVAEFYSALQAHPSIKEAELSEAPKTVTGTNGDYVSFKLKFSVEDFE